MNYSDKQLIGKAKRSLLFDNKLIAGAVAYITEKGQIRVDRHSINDKISYTVKVEDNKIKVYDKDNKEIINKKESKPKKDTSKLQDTTDVAVSKDVRKG